MPVCLQAVFTAGVDVADVPGDALVADIGTGISGAEPAGAAALGGSLMVKKEKIRVERKDWKTFLFIGFMGCYLSMECKLISVQWAGASLTSLINSLPGCLHRNSSVPVELRPVQTSGEYLSP